MITIREETRKSKPKTAFHRFVAPLERSSNKLWGSHVRVPARIARAIASRQSRRIRCRLNGCEAFQCALRPFGSGQFVISVNKPLRNELELEVGNDVHVSVQKDDSMYGLPMPEELSELLVQDKEGEKLFHALTIGKQRTLLYLVGSVKNPDKRIHRALAIVKHLTENHGTVNYRQLHETLRNPRRQALRTSR